MRPHRTLLSLFASFTLVAALLAAVVPAADDTTSSPDGRALNILVKITLGKMEDGDRKPLRSYQVLASGLGAPTRFSTSHRIRIPSITLGQDNDGRALPTSSFTYQNIGFQANIRAVTLGGDLVKINADIDDSALYDPADIDRSKPGSPTAPVVTGFQQSIEAVVREGAPLVSTLVDDPKGQSLYIQVGPRSCGEQVVGRASGSPAVPAAHSLGLRTYTTTVPVKINEQRSCSVRSSPGSRYLGRRIRSPRGLTDDRKTASSTRSAMDAT